MLTQANRGEVRKQRSKEVRRRRRSSRKLDVKAPGETEKDNAETQLLEGAGVKGRAALAGERIGSGGERRREIAGGGGVEGAEAGGEFEGGQAALAIEPADTSRRSCERARPSRLLYL